MKPGNNLSAEAKKILKDLSKHYGGLSDTGQSVLKMAVESWEKYTGACKLIDAEGLVIEGKYGPLPHPALSIKDNQQKLYLKCLKTLEEGNRSRPGRPPNSYFRPQISDDEFI
jgi:hypothetical protein